MIDTHCHLHFRAYDDDRDEVIARMRERHVRAITIGTNKETSQGAVELASKHSDMWCTVGLHPAHTHRATLHADAQETVDVGVEAFDDAYRALAVSSQKVVAIGEVGLDYYRLPEGAMAREVKHAQEETLQGAIALANACSLPLVLHVRDAHARMQEILHNEIARGNLKRRGVVHCFTGTQEEALAYHALGFLTSFTGIVTFSDKKHPEQLTAIQHVALTVPLSMMMLETDAPYLAPEPHRGKRNEPVYVCEVAAKIAQLKGVSIEEVESATDENAEKLFTLR